MTGPTGDDLDEYDADPSEWDPYQCTECGRWTEHGILSELDDEFICDECAMGATHAYGGDCV
jgi:hypothetical protein